MTSPLALESRHNPWLSWSVKVQDVLNETLDVQTIHLAFDDASAADSYIYQPGQFNMLYVPGVGEAAISISGDPQSPSVIPHTIRATGNVTDALTQLQPGDSLGLRGPFGSAWPVDQCAGRDVILVAGGIGLAPLRPVIYQLLADRDKYGNIWLLYGARTAGARLYQTELAEWQASMDVQQTVDRDTPDWHGHVGVVTSLLQRLHLQRPRETVLMTCGPEVMMWYTIRAAVSQGLPENHVWVSLERNMNCAVGFCGRCQLGPEFLCRDGPVFRYDRVAPFLQVEAL